MDTTFTFGKFKGKKITDPEVDVGYLEFLEKRNLEDAKMYRDEIERREALTEANATWAEKAVKATRQAMAKKYHPDAGGAAEDFREAMKAVKWLEECVKQANGGKP